MPPPVAGSATSGTFTPVRCRARPSSTGAGISGGRTWGLCAPGASAILVSSFVAHDLIRQPEDHFSGSCVRHEFHQRAVGIAKVDAGAGALGAETLHRAALDAHAAAAEMGDGVGDRPDPFKAQVAVAGRDRQPRHFGRFYARPMHVELLVAKAI